MSTSQIFTIGTALRRAEDNNVPVEVLVEGQWLRGEIAGLDGDGLVLVTPERTQCVVRNAHISVVRILANMSFDDEATSEPQATSHQSQGSHTYESPSHASSSYESPSYESPSHASPSHASASSTYDAPAAWEPAAATAADEESPFRWAAEGATVAAEVDDDRLAHGSAADDDVLVPDGGPLELGSGASWEPAEAVTETVAAEPLPEEPVAEPVAEEAPEEPVEAEVIELRPEPVAEEPAAEAADQPMTEQTAVEQPVAEAPRETSDDLVSRLLAESMREAGIEPGQPTAAPAPDELLHPDRAPVDDDEPRVFALPAPTATPAAEAPAPVGAAPQPTPVAEAAPVTPAAAPAAPPVAEPALAATAAEPAPAAPVAEPAPTAAAGDDWRSMLEGLRSEAAAPQAGQAANGQGDEKRRGRRLVMR